MDEEPDHNSGRVIDIDKDKWICNCGLVLPSGAAWSEHSIEKHEE